MIYIVEDDSSIRELEQYALQSNGYETTGCEDAASFWAALRSGRPDLVILDVMLPDEDGYQILAKLRADPACAATPVIMVTAKTSEIDVVKGLDHGADDYLTKPFDTGELLARVRALTRRKDMPLEEDPSFGDIRLDHRRLELCCGDECIRLGPKEFLVMECLLVHKNQIVPRNLLCEKVWGLLSEAEYNNVEVYISFLRKKLRALHSGVQIKSIRNAGYYLEVQS